MFVVLISVTLLAVSASAAAQMPRLKSVEPANGKAGDELVAQGQSLDENTAADLFLTDCANDHKVKMVEQKADAIRFAVPKIKPGRYSLMLLTKGVSPAYLQQPVFARWTRNRRSTAGRRVPPW